MQGNEFPGNRAALSPVGLWQNAWRLWADWQQSPLKQGLAGAWPLWQQGQESVPASAWPNPWAGAWGR